MEFSPTFWHEQFTQKTLKQLIVGDHDFDGISLMLYAAPESSLISWATPLHIGWVKSSERLESEKKNFIFNFLCLEGWRQNYGY